MKTLMRPSLLALTVLSLIGMQASLAHAQGPAGVAYTTWDGNENLQGFNRLTFQFQGNGAVTMIDAAGSLPGTYSQQGSQVTIRFGDCEYTGSINGSLLSGSARFFSGPRGGESWTWQVVRR